MDKMTFPQAGWDYELTATAEAAPNWLWHGFVSGGRLTLLTSQWKSGKTTLVALLLSRRKQGGTLAGFSVKPGKTIVVTEEDRAMWAERARQRDFGGNVYFLPRPFLKIPSAEEWRALLDHIRDLRAEHGFDLLVIDPLAPFLRCENNATQVLEDMLPLGELARAGMAILILHHPSKSARPIGQAARGSGAMLGHADIIMEMRHPGGDPQTRQRRFLALSRHPDTPARLLVELNAEATDYVPVVDVATDDFPAKWETLRMVLMDAPQKLTRRDILLEWPEDFERPAPATLARWLDRALSEQKVLMEGTGRKTDPLRYWVAEREAQWKEDIFYHVRQSLPFTPLHAVGHAKSSDDGALEYEDERE